MSAPTNIHGQPTGSMLDLLNGFVVELRNAGLPVSLTENLDAMEAVLAEVAGCGLGRTRCVDHRLDVPLCGSFGPRPSRAGSPT